MKAILVVDMPSDCVKCNQFAFDCCHAIKREIERENIVQCTRPDWCPLKPMPQPIYVEVNKIEDIMHTEFSIEDISAKIRLDTDKIFSLGWNACLNEILGEIE